MKKIQVKVNSKNGIVSGSNPVSVKINNGVPVTVKGVQSITTARLDALGDVDATGEIGGAVPVYDSGSDKYVVKKLTLTDVDGNLDGGTF